MKNIALISTKTTLLLSLLITLAFSTTAGAAGYGSVSKDGVNIRSGPSTSNEVIWEVFAGFPLQILEKKGKWVHCRDFEGDTGWIYGSLLSSEKTVIVRKKLVNLRVGPGKDYETVATVKYGVLFTPIEEENGWLKVRHENGTEGWIYNSLIWPANPLK